jgi:hypothetical protein
MEKKNNLFATLITDEGEPAVLLEWIVAADHPLEGYFIVERSYDGKKFSTIATISTPQKKCKELFYLFIDKKQPAKTTWYRVEQVSGNTRGYCSERIKIESGETQGNNPHSDFKNR